VKKKLRSEIRNARKLSQGIIGINIMFAYSEFELLTKTAIDEGIDLIVQGAGFSEIFLSGVMSQILPWCRLYLRQSLLQLQKNWELQLLLLKGKMQEVIWGRTEEFLSYWRSCPAVSIPVIAAAEL
jgi:hypothetical protein